MTRLAQSEMYKVFVSLADAQLVSHADAGMINAGAGTQERFSRDQALRLRFGSGNSSVSLGCSLNLVGNQGLQQLDLNSRHALSFLMSSLTPIGSLKDCLRALSANSNQSLHR